MAGAQTGTGKTAGFTLPMLQRLMAATPPPTRPAPRARADSDADARARGAGRRERRDYGKHLPLKIGRDLRRRQHQPADRPAAPRRRHPRRDAGPAARSRAAAHGRSCGTSRSSCSTKPIACSTWASCPTFAASSRCCRSAGRTCCSRRRSPTTSARSRTSCSTRPSASRSASATPPPRRSSRPCTSPTRARSATCCRGSSAPAIGSRCSCSRAPSTARIGWPSSSSNDGFSAAAIHGNKSQGARTRALADFKQGAVRVLVATDIAARGLDIDQLPHVVNYDLPDVAEHYVHRIGRTGRAGNEGLAISLVAHDERPLLKQIERLLGYAIPTRTAQGYVPGAAPRRRAAAAAPRSPAQQAPRNHEHRGNRGSQQRSDGGRRRGGGGGGGGGGGRNQQRRGSRPSGQGQARRSLRSRRASYPRLGRSHERARTCKLLAIDLDGTLVDSAPDIAHCLGRALEAIGYPQPGEARTRAWIGDGLETLIARAIAHGGGAQAERPVPARRGTKPPSPLSSPATPTTCSCAAGCIPACSRRSTTCSRAASGCAASRTSATRSRTSCSLQAGIRDRFELLLGGDSLAEKKPSPLPLSRPPTRSASRRARQRSSATRIRICEPLAQRATASCSRATATARSTRPSSGSSPRIRGFAELPAALGARLSGGVRLVRLRGSAAGPSNANKSPGWHSRPRRASRASRSESRAPCPSSAPTNSAP